mgnify:CR=1 FL=1
MDNNLIIDQYRAFQKKSCSCDKEPEHLKGDWSYWRKTCSYHVSQGHAKETFLRYTSLHEERLKKGIVGQTLDGQYLYRQAQ